MEIIHAHAVDPRMGEHAADTLTRAVNPTALDNPTNRIINRANGWRSSFQDAPSRVHDFFGNGQHIGKSGSV